MAAQGQQEFKFYKAPLTLSAKENEPFDTEPAGTQHGQEEH